MSVRYTSRLERQFLMERVGFEIIGVFRDYGQQPYSGKCEIIMVARKPAERWE